MDYTHWTIEQFKALPEPSNFTNEEDGLVEGLIIMPTDKLHESGYRLMECRGAAMSSISVVLEGII